MLGWIAVLIGALIMMFINAPIIDPILSLGIAAFVLFNVYRNIKPTFKIILQGMPDGVSADNIKSLVMQESGVIDLHDFHLRTLDGEQHVLSIHVVVKKNMNLEDSDALKEKIKIKLKNMNISHTTIEIEYNPQYCEQESC